MNQMTRLALDEAGLAASLLDAIGLRSADTAGWTRPAYSPVETACLDMVAAAAVTHGLLADYDTVGNLWLSPPGLGRGRAAAAGSHLDSVPMGGRYDGAAGVVAGLLCAIRALREGWPLRAVAFRAEESPWFGAPHIGARAAFGALTPTELAGPRRDTGRTLADHLREAGADPTAASAGSPVWQMQATAMFYELHIEQGPELVDRDLPAGAVGSVRGHIRWPRASCIGEAGHSGAVPRHLRRDPAFAVAELLHDLDEIWRRAQQEGADLVITAGQLCIDPASASPTRIPDRVTFSLDVRSSQADTLSAMRLAVDRACADIGRARRVGFDMGPAVLAAPVALDEPARALIESALARPHTLNSGAGHDAAELARRGVPAAMVFVRNRHGSHNPNEAMDTADFMVALDAMHAAMRTRWG